MNSEALKQLLPIIIFIALQLVFFFFLKVASGLIFDHILVIRVLKIE